MRNTNKALIAQAQACMPGSSNGMRILTARMATASLRPSTSIAKPNSIRLIHTTQSANATPSTSSAATNESPVVDPTTPTPSPRWTPASRRVGLIAKKVGMTTYFAPDGRRLAATVLQVSSNQISAQIGFSAPATTPNGQPISPTKLAARMAYTALQVAATDSYSNRGISKAERGHLQRAGITSDKKILHEFKVTKDAIVPLGTKLSAVHFVPGQKVDAQSKTRGKGFQGVMKRHGFRGLRASHGTSLAHRSHGSTGQNQDPGRVFPGKKMAGRKGGRLSTMQNLEVLRIDTVNDLVIVQGNLPGPEGGHVFLSDAKKALVARASNAFRSGKLPDHQGMATGEEAATAYLPQGVVDLPFPAGTDQMAKGLPQVIEVGPKESS
ncbi:translation protein [Meira miltonrushii]|uniref:Large ribosomal subunit protein uL3m n=1 Tax=Meira miltonrushii TaxID=1280837 RepID=A0A316VHY1_9BASI|nr:translation protein [Meira miltonrushii]PWN35115.1 translation protein [Meira miltonrushii]